MRIIQLTDLHIGHSHDHTFGVDVRTNFITTLAGATALHPNYLVVTGDLCLNEGEVILYEWIKAQLDATGLPYYVQAGNHDDLVAMSEVFGLQERLKQGELYYQQQLGSELVTFLDSSSGRISDTQMHWLAQTLAAGAGPALMMMHHPPLLAGVPHMDRRYALENHAEVLAILAAHPYPVLVCCGHYHVEKTVHYANVTVHITPSPYFQIDQFVEEFRVDHHRPGLRVLDRVDEQWRSTVRYYSY